MNDLKKARIEIILLYITIAIMLPRVFMVFDFEYWTEWALQIHRYGLTNVYDHPLANYHPLYYYFFWVYDKIQGSEFYIVENINYIKLFPLFFDMFPVIILCCFRQNIIQERIPYMYLLLNIAYLFNSCIWGQIDSIFTCIIFFSILKGFTRPVFSAFLFALALALKPQPIIFLPLLLLVWFFSVRNIKTAFFMLMVVAVTELIILLPFIINNKMDGVWHIVTSNVGRYPRVSVGAFNIWYVIIKGNPYFINDTDKLFILSYKHIGLLLFFASGGLVLLTLLLHIVSERMKGSAIEQGTLQMFFLASGMIVLYFFYFNTQMHERYAHPTLLFFFFYSVLKKDYKLYILASIPYFLSLDKLFPDYLAVQHYKIIWASRIIAIWYTATVIYGSYLFFSQYSIRKEYRLLTEASNNKT